MEKTYYLISSYGIDVIIIPELDSRVYVLDPLEDEINLGENEVLVTATISGRKLVFKMVSKEQVQENEITQAIHWYRDQNPFPLPRAAS
ncbi:hypothetical protein MTO98_07240 [Mucilaginibacter sp. SMC90]|uniref:hypothetical protein n=1 Tax=Mucilaginibacter sp. SMC90 TaxID=2929803 RepID=UPI001FB22919|nr:hypothetical protein [Mucilaginibacter sp. SMC90]UOE50870.1 hypothetical protein MTO98_07240 [Mucilaginibacter sp. SMC90]